MKNHLLPLIVFAISLLMVSCTNTSEITFVDGVTDALNNGGKITIGDNVTIGAGSVVTVDIPSDVVAVGNPCRVIKQIYTM